MTPPEKAGVSQLRAVIARLALFALAAGAWAGAASARLACRWVCLP
jgi:hypothetical protein